MIKLDIDAPVNPRSCVKFKDGGHGILMTAEKARSDAEVLRWVVGQIGKGDRAQSADLQRAVGSLKSLAHQFDMAASGEEPRAP